MGGDEPPDAAALPNLYQKGKYDERAIPFPTLLWANGEKCGALRQLAPKGQRGNDTSHERQRC